VLGKGNKERLAYMPTGTWQRLKKWVEEVRGRKKGRCSPVSAALTP
jgi:site-specific recombinase XerD